MRGRRPQGSQPALYPSPSRALRVSSEVAVGCEKLVAVSSLLRRREFPKSLQPCTVAKKRVLLLVIGSRTLSSNKHPFRATIGFPAM